jgi:hypothetical protein
MSAMRVAPPCRTPRRRLALLAVLSTSLAVLGRGPTPASELLARPALAAPAEDQAPGDAVEREPAVSPASLGLRERRVAGRLLWVQDGVADDQAEWVARGAELGARAIAEQLGLAPPREPLGVYVLADQASFRHLTSRLTSIAPTTIHEFEGGRAVASGSHRGIYLNAAALPSPAEAARVVAHELAHLAEKDRAGTQRLPAWFSEGVAEYVGQSAMAWVDAPAAEQRRWRREAVIASALHLDAVVPLSALDTPRQWNDAMGAGYERRSYSLALLAVDWLVRRTGERALPAILQRVAAGASFPAALDTVANVRADHLQPMLLADLRSDLLRRFSVGLHVLPAEGPPGTLYQFAAVGLAPGESLSRQFVREDGRPARASGPPSPVLASGAAFWTFQTRTDSEPATWTVWVDGDRGTRAALDFRVIQPPADGATENS